MLTNCQINNFKLTRQIGSGAYGLVFHAVDLITENEYAIKAVVKDTSAREIKQATMLQTQLYYYFKSFQNHLYLPSVDLDSIRVLTDEQLQRAPHFREIALHLQVHAHPNVVTVHQVLESPLATFLVLDYCERDLFSSIVDHQYFARDGALVKRVFLQLCSVLQYCHARGVYHCDIKPENILLDAYDNVCLCDFGLSTLASQLPANVSLGSSYYMAPERLSCPSSLQDDSAAVAPLFPTWAGDVWSLGIILINLTCIRNPWLKAHQLEDTTFSYYVRDPKVLLKILPISQQLFEILTDILQLGPTTRPNLSDIMERVSECTSFTTSGPLSHVAPLSDPEIQTLLTSHRGLTIKQMLRNYHSDEEYSRSDYQDGNETELTSEDECSYERPQCDSSASNQIRDVQGKCQSNAVATSASTASFPTDFELNMLTKNMSVMTNYSAHSRWLPQY
ncbi:LAME_0H09208g1_1 [Lachancea meyersii CBS 8951]|uniref:non-specific serine/threonine protein kinase n=1 Tax=Lachancea meyersii CBS 8951 TaxID=1266667 RepID=A0A1G4KFF1_9SACH|nr:LAME_0H09208g1_1 [Lachancea meyersii CBS 8951]